MAAAMASECSPQEPSAGPQLTAAALAELGWTAVESATQALRSWDELSAASVAELSSVKKGEFRELKSFAKPPALVAKVAVAVMKVLGYGKEASWEKFKTLMVTPDKLVKDMTDFDIDQAADGGVGGRRPNRLLNDRAALEELLADPVTDPEVVQRVSKALKGASMWLRAVAEYRLERLF